MLDLDSKVKYMITAKGTEQQNVLFNKLVSSQANRKRADVVFQEMLNKVYKVCHSSNFSLSIIVHETNTKIK